MEQIRLIWDFWGADAEKTAEHHAIHVGEFLNRESLQNFGYGHQRQSEKHCISFLIVSRADMILFRDALRPNRATTV